MTAAVAVPMVALVTHARDTPAGQRERFAAALHRELTGPALILQTCHRVEAYIGAPDDAARLAPALPAGGRTLTGETAVHHAITVAVGRDSVVLGEDQILHQIRAAVDAARAARTLDSALERLFAIAIRAGRLARSWRQAPPRSLADVALTSIERQVGSIRGRELLVVGAGRMGRLATKAALSSGASVAVANRSPDRAEALAASAGGRTEAFDCGPQIGSFAGVVVGLAGPWPIGSGTIEALASGTTVVVDLSVPTAVPENLAELLGTRLITADALALSDLGPPGQDGSASRLDALVDRSSAEFVTWLRRRDGPVAADALVRLADREREAELAALWRRLPDLEPDARDAIEAMSRHLSERLLREPLERLGRDAEGREARAIREIFAL